MPLEKLALRSVCAVLALSFVLYSQETRGTLVGRITDPSGATIAGAEIAATNTATGVKVGAKTNAAGNYTLPYLLSGIYTIESEMPGFKKFVREGVQIRVNDTIEVNVQLEVGAITETVEVKAETPLLSTAEASLGQVIDERRVAELPSFGGSPMTLAQLAPGVINSTDMRLAKAGSFSINKNSDFSTDGAGRWNNEFSLDGVSNTQASGTSARVGFIPPQSAVAEFKVQTSSYDASVGHTIGSLVNVSTKAGTSDLHGEAYWWLRNSAFDTPNIFQNRAGQKLPKYQDNRYGLAASGPVKIPRVYNGQNKTFWFYAWEGNKFGTPQSWTDTVPTAKMRAGDLSELLAIGSAYQVYDPLTTAVAANGRFSRQPIPGNVIPASRLDPVAQKILNYYPTSNATGTREFRQNYFLTNKALESTWLHMGRLDHAFSQNHRIFLRLNSDFWEEHKNRQFENQAAGIVLNRKNKGVSFDDVYVFNPTLLLNMRYGITRALFTEMRQSRGFDLTSLGFSPKLAANVDSKLATFPNVQIGSLTQLGNWESGDGGDYSLTHSFAGTVTKLWGDHNIRSGVEFRVYRENQGRFPLDTAPQLAFSNSYTRGPLDNSPGQPVGGELAAFLLGVPAGSMNRTATEATQDRFLGLYIQDDYKVSTKLTLNLGLRYEYETPITERFNRSVLGFAGAAANPIEAQARANYAKNPIAELPVDRFRVLGGLTFAGVNGAGRGLWQGDRGSFMPRIGLAWQLRSKTVLRAGYGLFYDSVGVNRTDSIQTGFSQSTPIQASLDSGLTYIASTANPFPNGLLQPAGAAGGLTTNLGQSLSFFRDKRPHPSIQRWSFGWQEALPNQFLMEASYVASRGTRLNVSRNINNTPAEYLSRSPVRDQKTIDYLSAVFPNPFYGINPIYGQNTSRSSILRPYPEFGGISFNDPVGYSWYHSLQTRLERRLSQGYTFQLSYTWSKTMQATEFLNATDPVPYRSISDMDRTHRFVASGIWELPFGKGRHFGGSWPRALDFIAGGWQLNGIMQRQSGAPLGFGDVWTLFTGNPGDVKLPRSQRSVDRWFNTGAGFNKVSAQQLSNNIRVSPLRFSGIRADGQARWDFSAIKNFRVTEKVKTQFRGECLNAWNHPNLSGPSTSVTSSAFGTITGQDVPRSWQFSLRVTF